VFGWVHGESGSFRISSNFCRPQVFPAKNPSRRCLKGGLSALKSGMEATITTEKKEGEEVVTKVVVLVTGTGGAK
jgi:hypothetical protein